MVQLDVLDFHCVSMTTISTDRLFIVDYAYVILMLEIIKIRVIFDDFVCQILDVLKNNSH